MYYITEKNSETGKKFQTFYDKRKEIYDKEQELSRKYNFQQWGINGFFIQGKIDFVRFDNENQVDMKVWKKDGQNYSPRLNTKKGKEIQADFDQLESLSWNDLNACVGWDTFAKVIGTNKSEKYFGFTTMNDWDTPIPADCKEITNTEWKEIFEK